MRVPSEEGLKRVPGREAGLAPAASGKGGLSRLGGQRSGACTHVEGLPPPQPAKERGAWRRGQSPAKPTALLSAGRRDSTRGRCSGWRNRRLWRRSLMTSPAVRARVWGGG